MGSSYQSGSDINQLTSLPFDPELDLVWWQRMTHKGGHIVLPNSGEVHKSFDDQIAH